MTRKTLIAMSLLLFLSCSREARSASPPRTVVLELFTSQGCSSCPPADRLLSRLRTEKFAGRIIPLAYHVDYWNSLGWRDPFSSPEWSERQRQYVAAIPNSQAYTPQLVIDGRVQLVGSAEAAIRAEIARQLKEADRGTVTIDRVTRNGQDFVIDLHAKSAALVDLVVVLYENGVTTKVTRGENANRALTNDAIVRWRGRAGTVGGADREEVHAKVRVPIDPSWRAENVGVAAFLQDAKSRAILGAASS
jgi:hypothetical protein